MNQRSFFVALARESTTGIATRWKIKSHLPAEQKQVSQTVLMTTRLMSAAIGVVRQVGIQIIVYNQAGKETTLSDESRQAIEEWANAGPGSLILGVTDNG